MGAATLLTATDVSKQFGGLWALNGVDLAVEAGEIVGLIGPNGAGKSTLFNVLMGLTRQTRGEITFRGKRVEREPVYRRARMGMSKTFQETALFVGMTVEENITVGGVSTKGLKRAVSDCHEIIEMLSLAEIVDKGVDELSFPEQAKVELARLINTDAELLLLDEVMAGLNPKEMDEVLGIVRDIRSRWNKTFLIIEHHMRVIMGFCDRVAVLNFGMKIADGSAEEVAHDEEVIKAYLGVRRDQ